MRIKEFSTTCIDAISYSLIAAIFCSFIACSATEPADKYMEYATPDADFAELTYTPSKTKFQVWAPTAQEARVLLYKDGETGHADKMFTLSQESSTGVWSVEVDKDLLGSYYAFNVKINDLWQGDTPGIMAKAVGKNGKRAVIVDWKITNPEGWESDRSPNLGSDMLIYELHIGSFTGSKTSNVSSDSAGKYLGVIQDVKLADSITTVSLAHLKELGVTHIKLMPIFDFINKEEQSPEDSDFLWGYDPLNFNVPEGIYSSNPSDPIARIKEFKTLVQGLHSSGFKVMMDVSYAYASISNSNFQKTFPGYFYRQNKLDEILIGENQKGEIASHRPAVQKFVVASLKHWMREYHIDGFCLDQLDLYDATSLAVINSELKSVNPSVLLMGSSSDKITRLEKNSKSEFAELMHTYSTALRADVNDSIGKSFLLGDKAYVEELKIGLLANTNHPQINIDSLEQAWTYFIEKPRFSINYISSYKGESISAYLKRIMGNSYNSTEEYRLNKLGYTYLFTSQGVPMLRAGEEFLFFPNQVSGAEKLSTSYNIDWSNKQKSFEYYNYIKALIQLRKKHSAFRLGTSDDIRKNIEFIPTDKELVVAYRIKENANGDEWEDIIVVLNSCKEAVRVTVPEGKYIVVCRDGLINELGLNYVYGQAYVSGQSAMILYRTDKQIYIPQATPKEAEPSAADRKLIEKPKLDISLSPVGPKKTEISDQIKDIKIE